MFATNDLSYRNWLQAMDDGLDQLHDVVDTAEVRVPVGV